MPSTDSVPKENEGHGSSSSSWRPLGRDGEAGRGGERAETWEKVFGVGGFSGCFLPLALGVRLAESCQPVTPGGDVVVTAPRAEESVLSQEQRHFRETHEDDFVGTGPSARLVQLRNKLAGVKTKRFRHGSTESMKTLSRRVYWRERGVVYQRDPRHVHTPAADDIANDNLELLELEHVNRSQFTRCLFLSQDCADITFTVNDLCQRMSNFTQQSQMNLVRVKMIAWHLKGARQWR